MIRIKIIVKCKIIKFDLSNALVRTQITAHTLMGTGNGPNKPNTINL